MSEYYKMKDITTRTGVSKSTVLYYLSVGLLPEPLKTSKNMSHYPGSYLNILPVIRHLQDKAHLPLAVIKQIFDNLGYQNITIESAVHYYETFLNPFRLSGQANIYNAGQLMEKAGLRAQELDELRDKKLLFSFGEGHYSEEDLYAAEAYLRLKNAGISFTDVERLSAQLNKLAREVHALYHQTAPGLSPEEELQLTGVLQNELHRIFIYLTNNYLQEIYHDEHNKQDSV